MKYVYWMNSRGEETVIGTAEGEPGVFKVINDFIHSHRLKSYYIRCWYEEDKQRTVYDYGSWSEFITVYERELNEK